MSQSASRSTPDYTIDPNPILSRLVLAKTFLTLCVVRFLPSRRPPGLSIHLYSMDVSEDKATNTVSAILELPGLKKEDIHTSWDDGEIMVWGETPDVEEGGYSVGERNIGAFCRCLRTPPGTKRKDVKTSLKNGLLTLTFPRAPETVLKKTTKNLLGH
ncbi:HSP20-like chaperone [Armillaria borealis]|uniref:HSP20-like chaperone n=1 Tax=Armillaria borealis TaxID=47425 RepID=A0AA39MR60_9AGAR|nr:HSP20-like chaperone [Armillaria borealis]